MALKKSGRQQMVYCSSCDAEVDITETDTYGRCQRCQDEYEVVTLD